MASSIQTMLPINHSSMCPLTSGVFNLFRNWCTGRLLLKFLICSINFMIYTLQSFFTLFFFLKTVNWIALRTCFKIPLPAFRITCPVRYRGLQYINPSSPSRLIRDYVCIRHSVLVNILYFFLTNLQHICFPFSRTS